MDPSPARPSAERVRGQAEAAGLCVDSIDAFASSGGAVGRSLGRLFGSYKPDYVERYLLSAPDGLTWVYVQPYSGQAAMPGEHHVPLSGSPPVPVVGEGSSWFDENRRFALRLAVLFTATILLSPIGIFLFIKLLPRAPKLKGGALAETLNRLPALTRLRYMGGPLSVDYLVPWTVQLHSVGAGQSRLVAVDPGTTKRGMGIVHRATPSFREIADLARGVQAVVPRVDHPAQPTPEPPTWDDLAQPWLAHAAGASAPAPPLAPAPSVFGEPASPGAALSPEGVSPPSVSVPPKERSQTMLWIGLVAGVASALFGALWIVLAILVSLDPSSEPSASEGGVICAVMSSFLCLLPGVVGAGFAAYRLFFRQDDLSSTPP